MPVRRHPDAPNPREERANLRRDGDIQSACPANDSQTHVTGAFHCWPAETGHSERPAALRLTQRSPSPPPPPSRRTPVRSNKPLPESRSEPANEPRTITMEEFPLNDVKCKRCHLLLFALFVKNGCHILCDYLLLRLNIIPFFNPSLNHSL